MNRRQILKSAAAGIALFATRGKGRAESASPRTQPNVILCMADDQGWGDVGYNGHPELKTPNLDAMAAAALRFDRFYAAAPVCSPTRGSVLTGRHPNRYGCYHANHPLSPHEVTLAKLLKGAGYATGHFGKWHLGSVARDAPTSPGAHGFDEWYSAPSNFEYNPSLSHRGQNTYIAGEGSMVAVDLALQFTRRQVANGTPFLTVIWFSSPHKPSQAGRADRALYAHHPIEQQHFYGEVTAMDRAVGVLREELGNLGIRDNTLVWYCSDNGGLPELGITGGRGSKGSLYEGGLRVPAILEWPSQIRFPRRTGIPCVTSDIVPTILELVGRRPITNRVIDGLSLVPILDDEWSARPNPIGFWQYPANLFSRIPIDSDDANSLEGIYVHDVEAWLDYPWKLHRRVHEESIEVELYDLSSDPYETTNIASAHDGRTNSMLHQLDAWRRSVELSMRADQSTRLPVVRSQ